MKSAENNARRSAMIALAAGLALAVANPSSASAQDGAGMFPMPTYADLVDMADGANLVVKAKIRSQAPVDPAHSPFLRPGWVRLYVEAQPEARLTGRAPIGESLSYLVDVPLDADGKAPKLKKQEVLLFALPVPGRPDQLQLVTNEAQVAATPAVEAQVRTILGELAAPDARPRVTGVGDAFSVAGNLAGESETQIFLHTATGQPISLSVVHRPNMAPEWGVSWTDLVDESAHPPKRDTLAWYRLACFLPPTLPDRSNIADSPEARMRAAQDYALVIQGLGACPRNLHQGKL